MFIHYYNYGPAGMENAWLLTGTMFHSSGLFEAVWSGRKLKEENRASILKHSGREP